MGMLQCLGSPGALGDYGAAYCGCWEPNPGPLQEQYLLSTTEPHLPSGELPYLRSNGSYSGPQADLLFLSLSACLVYVV